jgi:VCBS repeat-containing protein
MTSAVRRISAIRSQLETFGMDRFSASGDEAGLFRPSFDNFPGLGRAVFGRLSENPSIGDSALSLGSSLTQASPALTLAAPASAVLIADVMGFAGNSYLLTSANLAAIGADTNLAHWNKLQMGLADIYIESQLGLGALSGASRDAALSGFVSANEMANVAGGYVAIDAIAADGNGAALLAALEQLGLQRGAAFQNFAGGLIPIDALDELAALEGLAFARPVYAMTNAGAVQSQNVAAMNVDYVHSAYGLTGAGVTIGFLSDSFNTATLRTDGVTALTIHYAQDQASGDLPAGVNILADASGTSVRDEGRAMAQLAFDIAPGASLAFHTAFVSMADFAQGILDLKAAGSDIIVDDVRYFLEPFFQDGILAQAVDTVTAGGAMYFSSAGNYGTSSYASAAWRPSGQLVNVSGTIYELFDFDPGAGIDFLQGITKTGTASVNYILNWDQPNFSVSGGTGAQSDMQLFVHNGSTFTTLPSVNIGGDAIDAFGSSSTTWTGIAIGLRVGDATPGYFQYVTIGGTLTINEYQTNSGTSFGHSNAAGAISVGASDWVDSGRFAAPYVPGEAMPYLEAFSSRGDVPILFNTAGTRLTAPVYRSNVDFTASDGGNNTFFGSDNPNTGAYTGFEADTSPNFYGTSAAAPNAAAIAALLMQRFPSATNAQIEQAMKTSAIDVQVMWNGTQIGDGVDNRSGWGHIMADRAVQALQAVLNASTQLDRGEVAIISYETDTSAGGSPDGLRFVLLDDLASGGTIYITDRSWNGTAFTNAAGEGTYVYTAGSNQTAGTIITLTAAQLTAAGITLSNAGEAIYVYQGGQDAPTRFLFAIEVADGNSTFNGSLVNTGLTAGLNAVAVQFDNASYAGSSTQIPATQLIDISTSSRWHGHDNDDIGGTPNYSEVADTTVHHTFTNPDMVIIAGMAGGGQSDAMLRIGRDEGATTGSHLVRMFRDNVAFNHITDVTFDIEGGFFFFVDSDGNFINRIMRGNISDLVSGVSNPTFTQVFATDNMHNGAGPVMIGELITGIEIDKVNNKIYWWDGSLTGDFEGGWQLYRANYDGTGLQLITTLDTENANGDPLGFPGGMGDWALDLGHGASGYAYAVSSRGSVDGFGNVTLVQNHIVRVDLGTGVITVLALDAADARSGTGGGLYNDGRLIDAEGQIIALDVDSVTGIVYFITHPVSASASGGLFSYNPATDDLQELWNQPSNNAHNTLQSFPTANMTHIEVDEIGGRIYISATSDTDTENDGSPGTNESDASIFSLALGAPLGTAPTLFQRVYEPTANGAPQGMEIDYAPVTAVTAANTTYTESTNLPASPAGPVITVITGSTVTDADTTTIQGATVAITSGFVAGDTLSFTNSGGITGSYNAANGVVTFTGSATLAAYQTVLNSIRFTNAGDNPTNYGANASRTISFTTFDGLLNSDPATASITIVGINDRPVNTVSTPQAASEDTAKVITGLSVFDVDADPATQDITVTLSVLHGTITVFTGVPNGIQVSDIANNGTATVTITATQNEINATFGNAAGVTYLNTLDFNGVETLTMTTNDQGFNGNDPGLSGTGTSESDQDTVTINIAAVNDAPVVAGDGTEDSMTILEDTPSPTGQSINSLFAGQYTDQKDNQIPNGGASSPGAFSGIAVVANGSSGATGQWQFSTNGGANWTDIGAVSLAAAKLFNNTTLIRFNPALNYNGAEPTLTVRLIDNSLGFGITDAQVVNISGPTATGGTTAYSAGTVVLGGTITPVNDAPTSAGLSGDAATYTEQQALAALLDVGSNAVVADVDSANFDTGTLTVAITGGLVAAEDQLVIRLTGTVSFNATAVFVNGTQIATYTGAGAGGGPLVFTFDPDATPAAISEVVRAVSYTNTGGDAPTGGTRTLTWTFVDGDGTANSGADTLVVNSSVNVVAVNDSPTFTNAALAAINEDAPNPAGETVFNLFDGGYSDPDNAAETINGLAIQGNTANAGTEGSWQYSTDGGANWFNVGAVTVNTALMLDDTALLRFLPVANFNGVPANLQVNAIDASYVAAFTSGATRVTLDLATSSADSASSAQLSTSVTAVNDAPTSANLNGDAVTWTEGDATTLLDLGSNATIADIDSANFDTGTLTVHIGTGLVAAQDQLVLSAVGGVTFDATTVSVAGTQIATYTGGGAGGGDLVFTFDADATPAAVQALMRAIGYTNTGGISPTGGARTINWTLVDGDGTANSGVDTLALTTSVNVVSINDEPVGTDATYVINEDATYTFSEASFGFSDVNLDDFAGVVVTTIPVPGTLFYDADGAGVGAPVAVTAGQFVSAADIALGRLYYTPLADQSGAPFTSFTFQVRDDGGTAAGGIDTDQSANTITFDVTALNDAPVNTVPGGQTTNEDSGFTLSTGNGNAISVADVDATNLTVTLSVANGQLTLASTAGLSFGTGDGTGDTTMTFSGTAAAINAALGAGLSYVADANFNGADAISVQTTDNGETGAGGTQIDGDSIAITVNSVNDEPEGADKTASLGEDGTYILATADFGFSDAIDGDAFAGVVLTTLPAAGTLLLNNVAITVAGTFVSATDIANNLLTFQPAADQSGTGYAGFTFQVRDAGGTANGGVDTDQSANSFTFDVAAVNDAPVNSVPGAQNIDEDTFITFNAGNGNLISISDVDAGSANVTVTLAMTAGQLTLSTTAGLSFSNGDGLDDTSMTFSGTIAAINAALDGLLFEPTINDHNDDVLTITTNDGGASGGAAQQDVDTVDIIIDSVNDAPSGTDTTVTASEDDPYVFTAADFGFTDPADGNAFSAVSIMTFPAAGTLFLDSDGPGGAAPVDLSTLGAGAFVSVADINAGHLYFQPVADQFGANYASFTFKVQDDGGTGNGGVDLDPSANTMTIDVEPDNLAPVVDLDAGAGGIDDTNIYVEQGAPSGIGVDIAVSDPDAGDNIEGAIVEISDPETGDVLTVSLPLPAGISVDTVNSTDTMLILIGTASASAYATALGQVGFSSTSDDPTVGGTHTTRSIGVTVNDGDVNSASATMTMTVFVVDDTPVAQPDAVTTDEASSVSGNVFSNNGSGADADPDGPPLEVAEVNSSAVSVGAQITLASGALLTLNANGTFDYDPNGAFDFTPTIGSGASNTPSTDSFTYRLAGGGTTTVTITINGIDTDDLLLGTSGNDLMFGGDGSDTIRGLGGNDALVGGDGDDSMEGGLGDDTYYVQDSGDIVTEAAGEGTDRVAAVVSYVLAAGVEVETLEAITLSLTTPLVLGGNEFANRVIGNAGDNFLSGGGADDVLHGLQGDDTLHGGAGNDSMSGGTGNDTYYVEDSGDIVNEEAGEGIDRIATSVSYTLDASTHVEVLEAITLGATDALDLSGNEFANVVIGNDGANVLKGGGGNDVLIGLDGDDTLFGGTGDNVMWGGTGNDTYYVGNSGDIVNEGAGEGLDQVGTSVSYSLDESSEVEILYAVDYSAATPLHLAGNSGANTIIGNDGDNLLSGGGGDDNLLADGGNDVLIGGSGADTMAGGTGNDIYYVDDSADVVLEIASGGLDRVATAASYTLTAGAAVEILEAVNSGDSTALDLTGNEFNNSIAGNAGANIIDGGSGNDALAGLGGADSFRFSTALGAANVDTIVDFQQGTDKIVLDDAIFQGLAVGALTPAVFVVGTVTTDEDQRIVYDSATGNLYYDADGLGGADAVLFATVLGLPALSSSDFTVI